MLRSCTLAIGGPQEPLSPNPNPNPNSHNSHTLTAKDHLHAANFEAEGGLGGGRILELAALYVARVGIMVPGPEPHLQQWPGVSAAAKDMAHALSASTGDAQHEVKPGRS